MCGFILFGVEADQLRWARAEAPKPGAQRCQGVWRGSSDAPARALGLEETLGDPLRSSNVEMPVAEALLALVTSRMTMPHSQLGCYGWLGEKVYARTGKDWSYTIFTAVRIFWLNRHHLKIEENGKANINWKRVEEDARRDGKYVLRTGTDLTTEEVALTYK